MYIQSVSVEGFKSYREMTEHEPFSPLTNLVVGLNGSGKSNFMSALEFVLSDRFSSLSADERRGLLHDGAGRPTLQATVTIHFDNSDGRLPVDKPTVSISRSVGLKKEEFRVDSRPMQQKDVIALLESAGLSRSNPYYIVRQGEVEKLVNATDNERLELLKEVAGTRVYDERRQESLKILAETDMKREQIDRSLAEITSRLSELASERSELHEYNRLEAERRAIEYTLADRKLQEARQQLESLASGLGSGSSAQGETEEETQLFRLREQRHSLETEYSKVSTELDAIVSSELPSLEAQERTLLSESSRQQIEQETRQKAKEETGALRASLQAEIQTVKASIADAEAELASARQDLSQLPDSSFLLDLLGAGGTKKRESIAVSIRQQLVSKKKSLLESLQQLELDLHSVPAAGAGASSGSSATAAATAAAAAAVAVAAERKRDLVQQIAEKQNRLQSVALQRSQTLELLRNLQKQADMLHRQQHLHLEEQFQSVRQKLSLRISRPVLDGIESIHSIDPAVPVLADSISFSNEKLGLAVDAALGHNMFHLQVDSEEKVAQLLSQMNGRRLPGRVSFMAAALSAGGQQQQPGQQQQQQQQQQQRLEREYPDQSVLLLSSLLQNPAIGTDVLLAKNLEVAVEASSRLDMDCVTLHGEFIGRKSSFLRGGYMDKSLLRLDLWREYCRLKQQLSENESIRLEKEREIESTMQSATRLAGEMDVLRRELSDVKDRLETLDREEEDRKERLTLQVSEWERNKQKILVELSQVEKTLTFQQAGQHESKAIQALMDEAVCAKSKIQRLESQLSDHLLLALLDLQRRLNALVVSSDAAERKDSTGDGRERLEATRKQIQVLRRSREVLSKKCLEISEKIEEVMQEEQKLSEMITEQSVALAHVQSQRSLWMQVRDDALRVIRETTSAGGSALIASSSAAMANVGAEELLRRLEKITAECKQRGGFLMMNRKAGEQYEQTMQKKQELERRRAEVETSGVAIRELMEHLDRKKDETIHQTFRTVARNFSVIYDELMGYQRSSAADGGAARAAGMGGNVGSKGSKAELVLKHSQNNNHNNNNNNNGGGGGGVGMKEFVGVQIRVTSPVSTMVVEQMSGGEKTLLALTLIFAIQRCDPAPFYLFDEIDAHLDEAHALAVAEMIQRQSMLGAGGNGNGNAQQRIQFIVTSFKRRVVKVFEKCYATVFMNRQSSLQEISQEEAAEILAANQQQQQQQQQQQHPDEPEEPEEEEAGAAQNQDQRLPLHRRQPEEDLRMEQQQIIGDR